MFHTNLTTVHLSNLKWNPTGGKLLFRSQSDGDKGSITQSVWVNSRVIFSVWFCSGLLCSILSLCSGRKKRKKKLCTESWLSAWLSVWKNSGNKSTDGEVGCNIRVMIGRAPMALRRAAWGHRHPLRCVRNWAEPGEARPRCVGGRV